MQINPFSTIPREDLDKFHEKVLYLIENSGIEIKHEKILKRLSDFEGVKIVNNMVTFSSDLANKLIFEMEFDLPDYYTEDSILMINGSMIPLIKDLKSGEVRPSNSRDLVDITKIEHSLGITGTSGVRPNDIPGHLQEIFMYKTAWEYSSRKCNDIFENNSKTTLPCCRYIQEMAGVLDKRFTIGLYMESPKGFNNHELEIAYDYLGSDVPLWVGNFPICGVSSPIFLESGMAMAAAELFSGYLMLKLLHGDNQVYVTPVDSIQCHTFDWKYGALVGGSVEDIIKTIYQVSINNYYNIPNVALSMWSWDKEVGGGQQGFEKGLHTAIAALLGVRAVRVGGSIALDNIYSPEQLIIDYEMVQYIEKIINRRGFDTDRIMMDEILKTGPRGNHLSSGLTVRHFREEYYDPVLFDHTSYERWKADGARTLRQRAAGIAEEKIKKHDYRLPEDRQKEIDRIYRKAESDTSLEDSFKNI